MGNFCEFVHMNINTFRSCDTPSTCVSSLLSSQRVCHFCNPRHIFIEEYYLMTQSHSEYQNEFTQIFFTCGAPNKLTVSQLIYKFSETRAISDHKLSGLSAVLHNDTFHRCV